MLQLLARLCVPRSPPLEPREASRTPGRTLNTVLHFIIVTEMLKAIFKAVLHKLGPETHAEANFLISLPRTGSIF
ncbi:hypothetical protein Y1Q_0013649 [Alligator mississippiensis]|uniref:Uncharacterized protein n=1 Tax=Alligator mississippiensis TaxID=8496 RepID=A0A151P3K3_ALLMI|nr:hypothetical protein Y1Q_0013649 [Alligator mississippiensis]